MSVPTQVASLFSPSGDDLVVTLVLKGGACISRRISPGIMDERQALRVALSAANLTGNEVDSWSMRRASETKVVSEGVDAFLEALKRRR